MMNCITGWLRRSPVDLFDVAIVSGVGLTVYGLGQWSPPLAWCAAGVAIALAGYKGAKWASRQR